MAVEHLRSIEQDPRNGALNGVCVAKSVINRGQPAQNGQNAYLVLAVRENRVSSQRVPRRKSCRTEQSPGSEEAVKKKSYSEKAELQAVVSGSKSFVLPYPRHCHLRTGATTFADLIFTYRSGYLVSACEETYWLAIYGWRYEVVSNYG